MTNVNAFLATMFFFFAGIWFEQHQTVVSAVEALAGGIALVSTIFSAKNDELRRQLALLDELEKTRKIAETYTPRWS